MHSPEHDFVVVNEEDITGSDLSGLQALPTEEQDEIRVWLQPTDYSADSNEYRRHLSSHVPGTTEWSQRPEYQQWISSREQGALWVKAIAGAGKSVTAAYLAHGLQKGDKNHPVLYFFFRQTVENNRMPVSLLRDWLCQLLHFSVRLQRSLKESYLDQTRSLDSVAFDELWQHFESAVCNLQGVYCVADALDEMSSGNAWFIEKLAKLGQLRPANVKVLLTSRPLPQIESLLRQDHILKITLGKTLVDQDIAVYIQYRMQRSKLHKDLRQDAQESLMAKSQGSFLYTRLTMDDLLNSAAYDLSNVASVRKALDRMPDGLSEKYTTMLHDHSARSGVSQSLQLLILRWVTHSSRPLRLLEIAAMVDSLPTKDILLPQTQHDHPRRIAKSVIRGACGPLIEIMEDETVGVIHHSFTEFLTDVSRESAVNDALAFPVLNSKESHLQMAMICVNFLNSDWPEVFGFQDDEISSLRLPSQFDLATAHLHYPLLTYASLHWPYHVSQYGNSNEALFESLDHFFFKNQKAFAVWLRFKSIVFNGSRHHDLPGSSPLHIAAQEGLACYVEHLICLGHDIEAKDSESGTPMHRATVPSSASVVEVLLKGGADPDPEDSSGFKPLHLAAIRDHPSTVRILLENGVNPHTPKTHECRRLRYDNNRSTRGDTPVRLAFEYGHYEAALAFVPFLDSHALNQALTYAAVARHNNIVLAVLDMVKVEVNEVTNGTTLLFLAAHNHQPLLVQKLLHLGADASILSSDRFRRDNYGRHSSFSEQRSSTPLHGFALGKLRANADRNMTVGTLRLLLGCGCDIEATDATGFTPLHMAVDLGKDCSAIPSWSALALLDMGANPSAINGRGCQPLHLARNSSDLVHALCQRGADINAVSQEDGRTALHYSMDDDSRDRLGALLELNADCNVQDKAGNTPLHLALGGVPHYLPDPTGFYANSLLRPLLEHGANPNARNKAGKTPLHCIGSAQCTKWEEVKELLVILLQAGVDLESRMRCGKTFFLQYMSSPRPRPNRYDHMEDFSFLRELGCRLNACDFGGRNVLHLTASDVFTETMLMMREEIVDPLAIDYAGNTLLHYLARHEISERYGDDAALQRFFNVLLESELTVDQQNNLGQTPVYVALTTHGVAQHGDQNLLDFLTIDHCNSTMNIPDLDGIHPIHLGAIRGEHDVVWLVTRGADPFTITNDGQSALHLAARARQCNALGFLIDLCQSCERLDFIDHADEHGRTALHYACRSGRIESVRMLTDSGAHVNTLDKSKLSPLDACAEFVKENALFPDDGLITAADVMRNHDYPAPPSVLLPKLDGDSEDEFDDFDSAGIRYIVRHLIARGANICNMPLPNRDGPVHGDRFENVHVRYARNNRCVILLEELLPEVEKAEKMIHQNTNGGYPGRRHTTPIESFLEKYYCARDESLWKGFHEFMEPGTSNSAVFETLLRHEDAKGIDMFMKLATEPFAQSSLHRHPVETLVKYGYAEILRDLDIIRSPAFLPQEVELDGENTERLKLPKRLLFVACERELPNLEVLKVLVETGMFDLNCVNHVKQNSQHARNETVLHMLARSQHWWQLKAIQYLVEKGADIDHQSSTGMKPLHVAIRNKSTRVIETLLQNGANPNLLTKAGRSCLTLLTFEAGTDEFRIAHLLLDHGADPNIGEMSILFKAVCEKNLDLVNRLLHLKANPNRLCEVFPCYSNQKLRPLRWAGREHFNTKESRPRMIPIIEALLRGGAQPFLPTEDGLPMLHYICECGGIVEPFIATPDIDIETRDDCGRTLFLAACSHAIYSDRSLGDWAPVTTAQQLAERGAEILAVDHNNRNALHLLLRDCRGKKGTLPPAIRSNLDLLLSHPSAPTLIAQRDTNGMTPILQAAQSGAFPFIAKLLVKGADPFTFDPSGNSVLHLAAPSLSSEPENFDVFSTLLSLNLPLNALNPRGESPLFLYLGDEGAAAERLPFFEAAGADFHVKDKRGQNLLHVIAAKKADRWHPTTRDKIDARKELFEWVVGKGVDVGLEDDSERTALDVAAGVGNQGILGLFERKE